MLQAVDDSMSEITGSVLTSHVFGFDLEKQKKKKQWKTSGANAHCTHRKQENPKDLPRLWFWPENEKKEHCVCVYVDMLVSGKANQQCQPQHQHKVH